MLAALSKHVPRTSLPLGERWAAEGGPERGERTTESGRPPLLSPLRADILSPGGERGSRLPTLVRQSFHISPRRARIARTPEETAGPARSACHDAAMDAAFDSLLLAARTEALALLRALLLADADSPPALLRERRLAACAILKVNRTPSPSGGGRGTRSAVAELGRGAKSDGAEPTSTAQTPFPSGEEPGRAANSDSTPGSHAQRAERVGLAGAAQHQPQATCAPPPPSPSGGGLGRGAKSDGAPSLRAIARTSPAARLFARVGADSG